jgi:hypothetical protein
VDTEANERAPFGASLLVAVAWYVGIGTVLFFGSMLLPGSTVTGGEDGGFTPSVVLILFAIFYGLPVIPVLVSATFVVLALVVRRVRSPIIAGSISAWACIAMTAALIAAHRAVAG